MVLLVWWLTMLALAIIIPLSLIYCLIKFITFSAGALEVSWIILCGLVANYTWFHWW